MTITLDVIRKLPTGETYLEPLTVARNEIKAYSSAFDKSIVLVQLKRSKCLVELWVNKSYEELKEELLPEDIFVKVKLI